MYYPNLQKSRHLILQRPWLQFLDFKTEFDMLEKFSNALYNSCRLVFSDASVLCDYIKNGYLELGFVGNMWQSEVQLFVVQTLELSNSIIRATRNGFCSVFDISSKTWRLIDKHRVLPFRTVLSTGLATVPLFPC